MPTPRIPDKDVERIKRMADAGVSSEVIASDVGVSARSVRAIVSGERAASLREETPIVERVPETLVFRILDRTRRGASMKSIERSTGLDRSTIRRIQRLADLAGGVPERGAASRGLCGTCGVVVELPCLACFVRLLAESGEMPSPAVGRWSDGRTTPPGQEDFCYRLSTRYVPRGIDGAPTGEQPFDQIEKFLEVRANRLIAAIIKREPGLREIRRDKQTGDDLDDLEAFLMGADAPME